MLQILIYFFIGLSLSMDTFSLSLSIGTTSPAQKKIVQMSLIVGIFHFFMPILGSLLGGLFSTSFFSNANYICFFIFLILALQMYLNRNSEEQIEILNLVSIFLFAISVSMDSFSVGIALGITKDATLLSSFIFQTVSTIFTYLGLKIGKNLSKKYQEKTTYFGIFLMIIIALKYLIFN